MPADDLNPGRSKSECFTKTSEPEGRDKIAQHAAPPQAGGMLGRVVEWIGAGFSRRHKPS